MAALSCSTSAIAGGQALLFSPLKSSASFSSGNLCQFVTVTPSTSILCKSLTSNRHCGNDSFSSASIGQLPPRVDGHEFAPQFRSRSRQGPAPKFSHLQISVAGRALHWKGGPLISRFSSGSKLSSPGTVSWVEQSRRKRNGVIRAAYISPPGAPPDAGFYRGAETEEELRRRLDEDLEPPPREDLINGGLVRGLIFEEKTKILIVFLSLVCGTACTLSMPIFSGTSF
jgi:hypothetical protein